MTSVASATAEAGRCPKVGREALRRLGTEKMRTPAEVISELKTMLRDMLAASASGASGARYARAHGYVDGYMRAMLDLGVATRTELLAVVAAERTRFAGPAVRIMEPEQLASPAE
jgi:hypothetical protein